MGWVWLGAHDPQRLRHFSKSWQEQAALHYLSAVEVIAALCFPGQQCACAGETESSRAALAGSYFSEGIAKAGAYASRFDRRGEQRRTQASRAVELKQTGFPRRDAERWSDVKRFTGVPPLMAGI
jgi:hypothetical protein